MPSCLYITQINLCSSFSFILFISSPSVYFHHYWRKLKTHLSFPNEENTAANFDGFTCANLLELIFFFKSRNSSNPDILIWLGEKEALFDDYLFRIFLAVSFEKMWIKNIFFDIGLFVTSTIRWKFPEISISRKLSRNPEIPRSSQNVII